ncbi:hypothetical protein CANCADRAFT_23517 [Tortispora caseinolytica NRRL Y-17796]|uniref:Complex 1 LYR protein domain-containing protein n=1 Tax=Tortispora caseinolytica NRRL Y-17796 TaxID=767744 RepID=A0A1E4TLA6_9ASCO|nr:hypothetical protein CANCADRAFT_23517 [Tortispora caseinolytica NRRL Y-17796]
MIIPTMLAEPVKWAATNAEARKKVLHLYRRFYRGAPTIVQIFELEIPASSIRTRVRQEFERYRYVEDLPAINVLYAKGQMQYQEVMNLWMQKPQLMKYLADTPNGLPLPKKQETFMDKFLSGSP